MAKNQQDKAPAGPVLPGGPWDFSTAADIDRLGRECDRLFSGMPFVKLTKRQLSQVATRLFSGAGPLVDLVAIDAERAVPGLRDPRGVGAGLRLRQARADSLYTLWRMLSLLTEQVYQHYMIEQALAVEDAAGIVQATLAADPGFPSLKAAERLLLKGGRWKRGWAIGKLRRALSGQEDE